MSSPKYFSAGHSVKGRSNCNSQLLHSSERKNPYGTSNYYYVSDYSTPTASRKAAKLENSFIMIDESFIIFLRDHF